MNTITFLGTGGARIMLASQLLATGGMIIELDGTSFSLDPGPGALVNCFRYGIKPINLDGIIISHRHLDHAADANAMIEAMTKGGLIKKGQVFAPSDALVYDPVVLKYLRSYVQEIVHLKPRSSYQINNLSFTTSMPHLHDNAETYGFLLEGKDFTLGYIPDTAYFPELAGFYQADYLVVSMLRLEKGAMPHLSVKEVEALLLQIKPKTTLLTHFGYQIYQKGPRNIADEMAKRTGLTIIAAEDGMKLSF